MRLSNESLAKTISQIPLSRSIKTNNLVTSVAARASFASDSNSCLGTIFRISFNTVLQCAII
jgi:hypothetical protein